MQHRKERITRRKVLNQLAVFMGAVAFGRAHLAKAPPRVGEGYDPQRHRWLMAIDIRKCIGCGLCVDACKKENSVPEGPYYRTWIERYTITKAPEKSGRVYGETIVDSPQGGINGFPAGKVRAEKVLRSFFVPKLCNLCEHSPCSQACPVGATFDTPDGVVLVDPTYCVGCGFCVQACPYGCRFIHPVTKTAEKCTLCYHRITKGLKPACVEVCPSQARIFGDLKDESSDSDIDRFLNDNQVQVLKPNLGTGPRVLYAGLDGEVR